MPGSRDPTQRLVPALEVITSDRSNKLTSPQHPAHCLASIMNQRIVILLLLSIASIGRGAADSNLRANVVVSHHQRRELTWTWWTNLMQLLSPAHHTSDASDEEVIEGDESDEEGITYEELEYGENYSVAGGGVGSSIGGIKGTASVLIYIVAAMVATVIGAAMVVVWVRSLSALIMLYSQSYFSISDLISIFHHPLRIMREQKKRQARNEIVVAQPLGRSIVRRTPGAFVEIESVRTPHYKAPTAPAVLLAEC